MAQRQLENFDTVLLKDIGTLTIELGPSPCLTVETSAELIGKVQSTVQDNKLVLELGMNWLQKVGASLTEGLLTKPLKYTLTVPRLKKLEVFGLGQIETGALEADAFFIVVNGTGNITLAKLSCNTLDVKLNGTGSASILGGRAELATVMSNGSGEFLAEQFETCAAKVTLNGLGKAKVHVTNKLDVEMNGAGELSYRGKPALSQDVQGMGRITCLEE
jgi:hypothetical protein